MYVIKIFLPVYNNEGKPFANILFKSVKEKMTQSFGGVTMYTKSPAVGIWKQADKDIRDEIVIFEVIAKEINADYWHVYKIQLQDIFEQSSILVRATKIELL